MKNARKLQKIAMVDATGKQNENIYIVLCCISMSVTMAQFVCINKFMGDAISKNRNAHTKRTTNE